MNWAEQLGAKCSECPLGQQQIVPTPPEPPTQGRKARLVIVGDCPSKADESVGRPFEGAAGAILNDALKQLAIPREECHITTAIKCRAHRKLTGKEWTQVRECCSPILEGELANEERVIAMGKHAAQMLAGIGQVDQWRGYPVDGVEGYAHLSVFPMQHPASLFRNPAMLPVWATDLVRGIQHGEGTLPEWEWSEEILEEGPELLAFLRKVKAERIEHALDVETGGKDPFTSPLTVVGLATLETAASFAWPLQSTEIRELFISIVEDAAIPKVLQNGVYDEIALSAAGITLRGFHWDTLSAGCVIAPQILHGLEFQASVTLGAPHWKSEHKVFNDNKGLDRWLEADIGELSLYNARDNGATIRLKKAQETQLARVHRGEERFATMMRLGELGKRMKCRGMLVDPKAREAHRVSLRDDVAKATEKFNEAVGRVINYNSPKQLHDLFFREWGITPTQFDKESGNPKLDGPALGDILALAPGSQPARAALSLLRLRERSKLLQTYVEDLPVSREGYVHPWWKFFTVTGRWNCDSPNMQNIPKPIWEKDKDGIKFLKRPGLRNLFVARPDHWLVEADYSQLELRILALLAGDEPLLEAYAQGLDVHQLNACALFGVREATKNQRDFAKRFVYGLNYGGGDKTVHKSLVVHFPLLTIGEVATMRKRWEDAHPQIATWQKDQVLQGRLRKYVEAPLSGRRYTFYLGRVEPTICYNYPMQSTAADIVNTATFAVDEGCRANGDNLLLQVHDALVCEGRDYHTLAKRMKKEMTLTVELNGVENTFPVDLQYGKSWGEMQPYEEGA